MPKESKPWFRKSRNQWYSTVNDEQVPLGVFGPENERAAWLAFQALLQSFRPGERPPDRPVPAPPPPMLAAAAVAEYLASREGEVDPGTLKGYRGYLRSFVARFGTEPIQSLDPKVIARDAADRPGWSDSTRRNYLATVELVLKWAGRPTVFDKPARDSAGASSVVTEDVYRQVLAGCRTKDFKALVRFLWHTGCRPSEGAGLTVPQVDFGSGTCRLKKHKTRKATKGDKLLYLSADALAVLREQCDRHKAGNLFRGKKGVPFSRHAIVMNFERISERIGRRVTAYMFRHSYATRGLERGLPDTHVAALLGHTSTRMIHAHYSHLTANARLLREAAEKVSAGG